MAYVAPTIRSVGDAVTAADQNIIANDVIALATPSTCIMTWTGYAWNNLAGLINPTFTEEVDNDSMHTTGGNNNRITINTAGVYLICATTNQYSGANNITYLEIYKNGSAIGWDNTTLASPSNSIAIVSKANATDYYQMYINNGGTATYQGRFSASLIGVNV